MGEKYMDLDTYVGQEDDLEYVGVPSGMMFYEETLPDEGLEKLLGEYGE